MRTDPLTTYKTSHARLGNALSLVADTALKLARAQDPRALLMLDQAAAAMDRCSNELARVATSKEQPLCA